MSENLKNTKASIDRKARNRLVAAIERFLAEKTTAFEFDDEIFAIRDETEDATVQEAVRDLWFFYDDIKDHRVAFSRKEWGYVQRLLLLLQSDYHLRYVRRRVWLPSQAVAAGLLAALLSAAVYLVLHADVTAAVCCGVLGVTAACAMGIWVWRSREVSRLSTPYAAILAPFNTFSELAEVRRGTREFRKQHFPAEIAPRKIRSRVSVLAMHVPWMILGFLCSPIVLLGLMLPATAHSSCVLRA